MWWAWRNKSTLKENQCKIKIIVWRKLIFNKLSQAISLFSKIFLMIMPNRKSIKFKNNLKLL
jgi:hypothetical protein